MDYDEKRMRIKALVRTLYDFQDMRIRMANRLKLRRDGSPQKKNASSEEVLDEGSIPVLVDVFQDAAEMEARLKKAIEEELEECVIYTGFLKETKGVGPLMAAVIISEYDIRIASTVSKLWMFTGLATGKVFGFKWDKKNKTWVRSEDLIPADRLTAGYKSPFNKWLRTKMCGVLAGSFLKSSSPYRDFYDSYKNRIQNEDGWSEEKKGHIHRAAIRYMVKMFLKDLYVTWRAFEGLRIREPYSEEYLGKHHDADPIAAEPPDDYDDEHADYDVGIAGE